MYVKGTDAVTGSCIKLPRLASVATVDTATLSVATVDTATDTRLRMCDLLLTGT